MTTFTVAAGVRFESLTFGCCGFTFALPVDFLDERRGSHKTLWCPNCGNRRHYPAESDLERERRLRQEAERSAEIQYNMRIRAQDEAEASERRRRAEKAAKTKMKNRIANGVCPCCNRSFKDLHRHMQTKHPKWTE